MASSHSYYSELESILPEKYRALLNFETVNKYIQALAREGRAKPSTARFYVQRLSDLFDFMNEDPDMLVKSAGKAPEEYRTKMKEWSKKYLPSIFEKNSARQRLYASSSFLCANGLKEIFAEAHQSHTKKRQRKNPFTPTVDDMRRAYLLNPWRHAFRKYDRGMRLWLLAQSQSGISQGDLLSLDILESDYATKKLGFLEYESIDSQLKKGVCPISVVLKRKKTGVPQITFFGEEVVEEFHRLREKQQISPSITGTQHSDYLDDGGRLFRIPPDGRELRRNFKVIQTALQQPDFTSSSLRMFFQNQLKFSGVKTGAIERMMGLTMPPMNNGKYSGLTIEKLRDLYKRAYPNLRLFAPGDDDDKKDAYV